MKSFLAKAEAVVIIVASFALAGFVVRNRGAVETLLAGLGPLAIPLAVLLFAIVASAPFSVTDALAIMNGVIFGPVLGSVVNAVGIVCAAIVGYLVALRTSSLLELDRHIAALPGWVRRYRVGSPAFLIAVRILPGIGGTIATQTAAAMRVPITVHILTMAAIAVPICTMLAFFGDGVSMHIVQYYHAHAPHFHHHHARPAASP